MKASWPAIGITLDYETGGGYSKMPWYALRENYCAAVSRFGALPIPLAHDVSHVDAYLDRLDGLMITGGAFDVSPELYGESGQHETVKTKDRRTQFEFAITRGALARGLPILGICGGEQLLNVVLGGTLIQHIPDSVPAALEHEQKNPRTEPGHEVIIEKNTLLHWIVTSPVRGEVDAKRREGGSLASKLTPSLTLPPNGGGDLVISTNTAHHQAVDKVAPGCVVSARTSDGVIEAIEYPNHPFCLGVQWHPEYFVTEADEKIMEAFVKAC